MRPLLEMLLVVVALATRTCGLPYREPHAELPTQEQLVWYNNDGIAQIPSDFPSYKENIVPEHIDQAQFTWDQTEQIADAFKGYETSSQSQQQQHDVEYVYTSEQPYSDTLNDLTISCDGPDKVCVAKSLCVNGYVHPLKQGFIRPGEVQECRINYETCCTVHYELETTQYENDQINTVLKDDHFSEYPAPSLENDQKYVQYGEDNRADVTELSIPLKNEAELQLAANDGYSVESAAEQQHDNAKTPEQLAVDYNQVPASTNQQLEQYETVNIAGSADASEASLPPKNVPAGSSVFQFSVPSGCAAALLCVEEQYCTLQGVISQEPVSLTSDQLLRRVPLSSCRDKKSGVVGKCCRDPNYVDPWPTGNLPANYSGGFDEQGFPTFLNIAKVRPPKKPVTQPTKTTPQPPVKTPITHLPPQIHEQQQPTNVVSLVPDDTVVTSYTVPTPTQIPIEISTPSTFIKKPYYTESSNQKEISVVPQTHISFVPQAPLPPCGVRNYVGIFYSFLTSSRKSSKVFEIDLNNNEIFTLGVLNVPVLTRVAALSTNSIDFIFWDVEDQRPTGFKVTDAAFGEIPWQAMVLWSPSRKILCSGALIAPNVVLTAASCVNRYEPNELSVKLGEWKLGYELEQEEPLPFEIIDVNSIIYHPGYVKGLSDNDTAMLLLKHPAKFDLHINTLCLPDYQVQETSQCIVTGWGKSILQAHYAGAIMHMVDVDLLSNEICRNRVLNAESPIDVASNVICGKARDENNMCQADVGGPLACYDGNGAYHIAGIYSQDTGCLPTNQVATFAPIDVTWVKEAMHQLPDIKVEATVDEGYESILEDYRKSSLSSNNQYLPPV